MKRTVNIGLIGYQFMGKAHSNAYRQASHFFDLPVDIKMHTICGRTEGPLKAAAANFGWENTETDWRKVIENKDIDIIDVSTPGDSHAEISEAAARAGKAVFCEKPLGNTLSEAKSMLDAVQKAGVANAIFHNYRKAPAVALVKRFVDDGRLGKLYHWRATYLQDWIADPNFPLVWRLQKDKAGSGAHGDLNSHIIDLAQYLVGDISEVSGMLHTFIKERPLVGEVNSNLGASTGAKVGEVTVDDAAIFMAKFANGVIGTFEASRFAVGRKNYNRFEINGSKGSVVFDLEKMNELEFYDGTAQDDSRGFCLIQASDSVHPYSGHYWPVGHIIGYEHTFINLVADAVTAYHSGVPITPNFEDGYKNQKVLDAVERSWHSKSWIPV